MLLLLSTRFIISECKVLVLRCPSQPKFPSLSCLLPLVLHVMTCYSCVSFLFSRGLAAVKRRGSRDRRVHLLTGHLRPGEQRLRQLLHQTGALSSISHHRGSPHCQKHWKNPTLSDAHEAWKKTQWLSLTPGLSLLVFFVPFQVWKAWRKDFSVIDPREKVVYKWWILFEMGILLFVLMFCLNSLPNGLFLLSVHCTWSFLPFFFSYSPLLVKRKVFLGG